MQLPVGMPTLHPHQAAFVDWFLSTDSSSSVLLVGPPGTGKTRVAAALTDLLLREGPALVVVPDILVPQWADQLKSIQRADPIGHERGTLVLDRNAATFLSAAAKIQRHNLRNFQTACVVPLSMARDDAFRPLLSGMNWNMVVIDDADHVLRTAARHLVQRMAKRGETRVLALAVSVKGAGSVVTSSWKIRRWDTSEPTPLPAIHSSPLIVDADNAEAEFLASVAEWARRGSNPPNEFLRRLVDRAVSSNLGYAVQVLERIEKRRKVDWDSWFILSAEERALLSSAKLSSIAGSDIQEFLRLGYALSLPDSKTRRLRDILRHGLRSGVSVVAANTDVVRYLSEELGDVDIRVAVADESMTTQERLSASASAREDDMPLLVSDLAISDAVLTGGTTLYHYDLPHSRAAFARRHAAAQEALRKWQETKLDNERAVLLSVPLVWNVGSDVDWLAELSASGGTS